MILYYYNNIGGSTELKSSKRLNTWNRFISLTVRILLILAIITGIATNQAEGLFLAILTLWLTFFPNILQRMFGIYLPSSIQILITLFIFAAQYLGEMHGFYYKFWWWDIMLHTVSGFVLGMIGFMFVYMLNEQYDKNVKLSPFFIILFSLCFAVTVGVLWEFFEFAMDRLFGTNMQKFRLPGEDGLIDTMGDLFVDTIGALIMSTLGYIYIREKKDLFFTNLFSSWFKKDL